MPGKVNAPARCPDCGHGASEHRQTKGCRHYMGTQALYEVYDETKECGCKRTPDEVRGIAGRSVILTDDERSWLVAIVRDELQRNSDDPAWTARTNDVLTKLGA